jgi:CRP-like cAMP-binding protein
MTIGNAPVIQRYSDGDVIISEGVISNNAYVVISGKVRITKKVNHKTVIVGTLKKGDVFGEMGLISSAVRSATVLAVGEVTVGFIDRDSFEKLLQTLPEELKIIIGALVQRLRITTEMLTRIGSELAESKGQKNN